MKTPQQRDLLTNRFRNVKPSRNPLEANDLHIPLVSMLRWCIRPDVMWRHVPNGEHRDPRTAAKLKAMGVLAGSADLEFFWSQRLGELSNCASNAHFLCALFLELKLPGRPLSDEQRDFRARAHVIGADYAIAYTIEDAIDSLGRRGLIKPGVEVCGRRWG